MVRDNSSQMRSFGRCRHRVSLVFPLSQHYSRDFDSITSLPRLFDAEDDRVEGALAIRLIIGLDFAVTLSLPLWN